MSEPLACKSLMVLAVRRGKLQESCMKICQLIRCIPYLDEMPDHRPVQATHTFPIFELVVRSRCGLGRHWEHGLRQ